MSWHEVGDDSCSKAKQELDATKFRETPITCLLPSVGRRLAHQSATGSVACWKNIWWDAKQEEKTKDRYTVRDMGRRLAAGRTPELLFHLMDTSLFLVSVQPVWTASGQPQRGLQAVLPMKGCVARQVPILDTYSIRGVPMADVSDLHGLPKKPGVFVSSPVCESAPGPVAGN